MQMKRYATLGLLALAFAAPAGFAADHDDDTGIVKGKVTDSRDKPVTNATVHLYHRGEKADKLEDIDDTTTNDDGVYEFKDVHNGTYQVVAMSGGKSMRDRESVTVEKGKNVTNVDLQLKKGEEQADEKAAVKSSKKLNVSKLRVTVTNSDKDAVKNAKVRVLSGFPKTKGDYSGMREITTGTTDSDGKYESDLQQGEYTVVVEKGGKEGYHKVTVNANERASDEAITIK